MSGQPDRRDLLKQAVAAVEEMRARVEAAERAISEPIAIVGIGCRMPGGVTTPEELWALLAEGRDAITAVPDARWAGDIYSALDPEVAASQPKPRAGFVDRLEEFDPHFFGVSPREAASMDPQHRMVLETAWEALEHASIAPDRLRGSQTGVFVGITAIDYAMHVRFSEAARLDVYSATGSAHNAAAGRLSYVLGLHGPSLAVDTACSSSLAAIHLACQSLRLQECGLALAGGVNTIVIPDWFVSMTRWGMLAPDGRCKAFDRAADGMVRAEGCGIVALKRLSDAEANGDRILAVILGSAVNQDGASSGLTVPNGRAQEAVIRQALRAARVSPAQISYVEAHGTGTTLGDPIELEALDAVLAEGRDSASPLAVGSIKTNLGHMEAAAGIAGLIKVVLALQHESIPRHLHFTELNPAITLRSLPVVIPREPLPWPRGHQPRLAGVSSFGLSGTNAHVVVREADIVTPARVPRESHLLTLSARSDAALRRQARQWRDCLSAQPALDPGDVAHSANTGRAAFAHRATMLGRSTADFITQLNGIANGAPVAGTAMAHTTRQQRPRVAMMFTGQGSQYVGMGRELYASQPVFRATLDRCHDILQPRLGQSLIELIDRDPLGQIDQTACTQPALFAIEYALYETWRSWGIVPAAVMGHSVGEYVAACVAGVFSLEDGLHLIAERGRLMQQLPAGGAMVAVFASEADVRATLNAHAREVSIAAVNGPDNIVISGLAAAVNRAVAAFEAAGTVCRPLSVSHAFHSSAMDPVLPAFAAMAKTITFGAPRLPLISNVTGQFFKDGEVPDAAYWTTHLRDAVRFADGVQALERAGYTTVLEVGPAPALSGMARRVTADQAMTFVPSLKKEQPGWRVMLDAAGALYRAGAAVDWDAVDRGFGFTPVSLPTYPFERERYWIDPGMLTLTGTAASRPAPVAARPSAGESVADRYALHWEAAALPDASAAARQGSWIVVGPAEPFSEAIERQVRAAGATVRIATDSADIARAMIDSPSPTRVVLIAPSSADWRSANQALSLRAALRSSCEPLLQVAQEMTGRTTDISLVVLTRNAQSTAGEDVDVSHAAVWGAGRALRAEHPELRSRLIDVAGDLPSDFDALWRALASDADELAVRGSAVLAPRLALAAEMAAPPVRSDGSYLITGGFGALGSAVARSLIRRGAMHLVLVGRSTQSSTAAALLEELRQSGANVQAVAGDVSDAAAVRRAVDTASGMAPLCGVVHAAGVNADAAFAQQDWQRFDQVMAGKVIGAWHLHNATRDIALDSFTLFSSSAVLLPTIGQANYAAANAALDGIAYRRRAANLAAVSINWGPWDEAGMAARLSARDRDRWQQHGIALIQPQEGVRLFEQISGATTAQIAVLPIAWDRFFTESPEQRERQLLANVGAAGSSTEPERSLAQQLAGLPPSERRRTLHGAVCEVVRRVLAVSPAFVFEPHQGLRDLGLDSLMAVELRNALQFRSGVVLPSTIAFDCADIEALTDCVAGILEIGAQPPPARTAPASAIAREVEELSDQDAEALLAQELEK